MPDLPTPLGEFPSGANDELSDERFRHICLKLPDLRATGRKILALEKLDEHRSRISEHMQRAQNLDAEFESWAMGLKEPWGYKTVEVIRETPDDILEAEEWPGPLYAYDTVYTADITNDYRMCRIFCNCMIGECCDWLAAFGHSAKIEYMRNRAGYVIQQMVNEVCATVPYMVRYNMQTKSMSWGQEKAGRNS